MEHRLGGEEAATRDSIEPAGEPFPVPGLERVRPAGLVQPRVGEDEVVVDPAVRPRRVGTAADHVCERGVESDLEPPRRPAGGAGGAVPGHGDHRPPLRRPPDELALGPHREDSGAVGYEEGSRLEVGADRPRVGRVVLGRAAQGPGGGRGLRRHVTTLNAMGSLAQIRVGGVTIGGGAPVVVQSMTLTKTHDVEATMAQIAALASAGCEVVRCAVPKIEDAVALRKIVRLSPIPVIADIHFNASLALRAIEAGVAAVRINPGNIGGPDKVELVVAAAKKAGIPMRIGANSGSLPEHLQELARRIRRRRSSRRRSRRSSSSRSSTTATSRSRSRRRTFRP